MFGNVVLLNGLQYTIDIHLDCEPMNPTLKTAFKRLEKADPDTQERWANTIIMTVDENGHDGYAEFVEARLEQADREIDAGLGRPAGEVFAEIHRDMTAKYGNL